MNSVKKIKLDESINFLNNRPYSQKYFDILEVR